MSTEKQKPQRPPEGQGADSGDTSRTLADLADAVRISYGRDVRTSEVETCEMRLAHLAKALTTHRERDSKMGSYFCAPMKNGRRCAADAEPWCLVVLDFDGKEGPVPDPEVTKAFFSDCLHFGYTTHSYTPQNGKHRIVLVADREITTTEYRELHEYLAEILPFAPDPALNHPDQPVFSPSCPPGAQRLAWTNEGAPVPVDQWLAAHRTQRNTESHARKEYKARGDAMISAFNQSHDLCAILEQHGYKRRGRRYLWPHSESGIPGVSILADGRMVFSHHSGDPLADGRAHDSFDTWTILEHGGDKRAATKEAARRLGISPPPSDKTNGSPKDAGAREPAKPPPRATLRYTDDELRRARLSPDCIVEDYLYADVAVLAAPGGTGKTTVILYECICIALTRPVWGLPVQSTGWILFISAEDSRETLGARLREIMAGLELSDEERQIVLERFQVWDVSGAGLKLARPKNGEIELTGLPDAIVAAYRDDPPVMIILDPKASFGPGEKSVNDAAQAIIEAARRMVRDLRCCVRIIEHVGKTNARQKVLDQYAIRDGSALADGCRMVAVMQPADGECGLKPPSAWAGAKGVLALARPKLSYGKPNQPRVWIKRTEYRYEHRTEVPESPEQARNGTAERLEEFLTSELTKDRYYTKTELEKKHHSLNLTRDDLRTALAELQASGRVLDVDLAKERRRGGRKTFLCPAALAPKFTD